MSVSLRGGMITVTNSFLCLTFSRGVRIRLSHCTRDLQTARNPQGRGADQPRVNSVTLMLTAASVPGGAIDWGKDRSKV